MEVLLSVVLLMADFAVPNPIIITLEFLWNSWVCGVSAGEFPVSAVMAGFTIEFTVHITCDRIVHNRIPVKGVAVFLVFGIMATTTLGLL